MCIISGEIEKVSNTNIIAAKINKNAQLTVYSNTVEINKDPVAMILPYPNKNIVPKIIETNKNDSKVFEFIETHCFPKPLTLSNSYSADTFSRGRGIVPQSYLRVHRAGSYRYSIAKELGDLNRADPSVFQLKSGSELTNLLKSYSDKNFGFIVCIIDLSAEYTPFAYLTSVMDNGSLFIPTKHYHTHGHNNSSTSGHKISGNYSVSVERRVNGDLNSSFQPFNQFSSTQMSSPFNTIGNNSNSNSDENSDDWDHTIYIINARPSVANLVSILATEDLPTTNYSFSKYLNCNLAVPKNKIMKFTKQGTYANIDIVVK